jgi:aspartate ammonia-lyase
MSKTTNKPRKIKLELEISEELAVRLDYFSKKLLMTKERMVLRAIEDFLDRKIKEKRLNQEIVAEYLDNKIDLQTLEMLLGKEYAKAAQISKKLLEKGEDLVESLD